MPELCQMFLPWCVFHYFTIFSCFLLILDVLSMYLIVLVLFLPAFGQTELRLADRSWSFRWSRSTVGSEHGGQTASVNVGEVSASWCSHWSVLRMEHRREVQHFCSITCLVQNWEWARMHIRQHIVPSPSRKQVWSRNRILKVQHYTRMPYTKWKTTPACSLQHQSDNRANLQTGSLHNSGQLGSTWPLLVELLKTAFWKYNAGQCSQPRPMFSTKVGMDMGGHEICIYI